MTTTPATQADEAVRCGLCGNHMTFRFASPEMVAAQHETEMVEMMAILTGWSSNDGQWICGRHDGQPKGNTHE